MYLNAAGRSKADICYQEKFQKSFFVTSKVWCSLEYLLPLEFPTQTSNP